MASGEKGREGGSDLSAFDVFSNPFCLKYSICQVPYFGMACPEHHQSHLRVCDKLFTSVPQSLGLKLEITSPSTHS